MASLPTGIDLPNPPSINTTPDVVRPSVPNDWDDWKLIFSRIVVIMATDRTIGLEMWAEYKRLTGR